MLAGNGEEETNKTFWKQKFCGRNIRICEQNKWRCGNVSEPLAEAPETDDFDWDDEERREEADRAYDDWRTERVSFK